MRSRLMSLVALLVMLSLVAVACLYPPDPVTGECADPAHGPVRHYGEVVCDTDYPTVVPTSPPVTYPTIG